MYDARESMFLDGWVDRSTQRVDMIASWERLVRIYEQLNFLDPLTDQARMGEFSEIVKETNRFLSRMRQQLSKAADIDAAMAVLEDAHSPGKNVTITTRQAVAFQKLKQQWICQGLAELSSAKAMLEEEPEEEDE